MPPPSPKNSEFLTRDQIIDLRLTDAGWRIVRQKDFDTDKPLTAYNRCAIEEYQTDNGPADYALCANSKILWFRRSVSLFNEWRSHLASRLGRVTGRSKPRTKSAVWALADQNPRR